MLKIIDYKNMEGIDELYGIYAIYHGLEKASEVLTKPLSYLQECAKKILKDSDPNFINKGIKNLNNVEIETNIPDYLLFSPKFIETIEKHLVKLEDEVPESYISELPKLVPQVSKRKKKCAIGYDFHKKSIILKHIKSDHYVWSVSANPSKISYHHIYKRKPN